MSDAEQILKQVEFYFSDSNLVKDKFLFTTQAANDGWVPIQTISQFERMKKFRPVEIIVDALRQSKELLEVSENGDLVRRKVPLPTNYNEFQIDMNKRSVFVNKLPTDATLDSLLKFFSDFAPINQVRMKKDKKSGNFDGSCLVEFKSPESVDKILSTDLKFNDTTVEVVSKAKYEESRAQKFGARRGSKGGKRRESKDSKDSKDAKDAKDAKDSRDASPVRNASPKVDRND